MLQQERQKLLSTLARSELKDIQQHWQDSIENYQFEKIRPVETGMVMAVARAGAGGEPFNLGEVTVSRCALRLPSGETGVGYVCGRNTRHAEHIALLDALAQTRQQRDLIFSRVIQPLQRILQQKKMQQQAQTDKTKVEFFTMVRGESE